MQITTELKSKIKQYQIDTNKGLWDSFDNIDYIDKNYCEVYNNDKGDNRNKFHLTKEQVIRLEELGSIYVNINQKYDK